MKTALGLRRLSYLERLGIFLIALALVTGTVGCGGAPAKHDLALAVAAPGGGNVTDLTNDSPYATGTKVVVQAIAAAGYQFTNWSAPAGTFANINAAQTTFTMPAKDVTITAYFVKVYDLTVAAGPAGGGTATDSTGASPYPAGTVVSIEAVANPLYQFVNWSATAGTFADANAEETAFTMPAQDVTVTANFAGLLDHATCYLVDMTSTPYIGEVVYLEDQFGALNATVGPAWAFCNPTEKMYDDVLTPVSHPDQHITAYSISYEEEPQKWFVEVTNQFGPQQLVVSGPVGLAVPTQEAGHEPPVGLDHYLLYEVLEGPSVEVAVDLDDQFGDQPDVSVYNPIVFANPVRKTHGDNVTEIVNPDVHAVLYQTDWGDIDEAVEVINQFGEQTLHVYGPVGLAVPSELESHPQEIEVGVKAGDWIKLEFTGSGWPAEEPYPEWLKFEFVSVEGTTVTVTETMHISDGTEESYTMSGDLVEAGETSAIGGLVIAANLTTGYSVYFPGYGDVPLEGETTRTYVGANRTVVYASISQSMPYQGEVQSTYYWDKLTGVVVELSMTYVDMTVGFKATETNMW